MSRTFHHPSRHTPQGEPSAAVRVQAAPRPAGANRALARMLAGPPAPAPAVRFRPQLPVLARRNPDAGVDAAAPAPTPTPAQQQARGQRDAAADVFSRLDGQSIGAIRRIVGAPAAAQADADLFQRVETWRTSQGASSSMSSLDPWTLERLVGALVRRGGEAEALHLVLDEQDIATNGVNATVVGGVRGSRYDADRQQLLFGPEALTGSWTAIVAAVRAGFQQAGAAQQQEQAALRTNQGLPWPASARDPILRLIGAPAGSWTLDGVRALRRWQQGHGMPAGTGMLDDATVQRAVEELAHGAGANDALHIVAVHARLNLADVPSATYDAAVRGAPWRLDDATGAVRFGPEAVRGGYADILAAMRPALDTARRGQQAFAFNTSLALPATAVRPIQQIVGARPSGTIDRGTVQAIMTWQQAHGHAAGGHGDGRLAGPTLAGIVAALKDAGRHADALHVLCHGNRIGYGAMSVIYDPTVTVDTNDVDLPSVAPPAGRIRFGVPFFALAPGRWADEARDIIGRAPAYMAAPQPTRGTGSGEPTGGAGTTTNVAGGNVVATGGGSFGGAPGTDDWFGQRFNDTSGQNLAQRSYWLQFIAIEVSGWRHPTSRTPADWVRSAPGNVNAGGQFTGHSPASQGSGVTIPLSQHGQPPRWQVDAAGMTTPFYDSPGFPGTNLNQGGQHDNAPDHTAMSDSPAGDADKAHDLFQIPGVVAVTEKITFHDYLVRGLNVTYRSDVEVTWSWASDPGASPAAGAAAADPGTGQSRVASAAVTDHIGTAEHNALIGRHPQFSYLRHS